MHTFIPRLAVLGMALGMASVACPALAQDSAGSGAASAAPHRAPDPQQQAARLAKRLGLSDDQTSKLAAILHNRQQQMAALRGDSSIAAQDRRTRMRSIQQDADTQINAVLTPDQQKQYAAMKQHMMDRWQNAHAAQHDPSNNSD